MSASNSEKPEIADYTELSNAFQNNPKEFVRILKEVYEDFLNSHMLLRNAITDKDLQAFKKIYLNLRSNINLFNIYSLRELMNNIEYKIEERKGDSKKLIEEIDVQFNLIFQSLENKIKQYNK